MLKISLKIVLFIVFCFINSCSNDFDYGTPQKAVETLDISSLSQSSVMISGGVDTDNGSTITSRGICYSTNSLPTILNYSKQDASSTLGNFSCSLDNLTPNTIYFARAFATNSYGTAYGNEVTFTALPASLPAISSTTAATLITTTSAKTGGIIINNGASTIISRGVCYSNLSLTPTISDLKTNDGTGLGTFTSNLTGLIPNTTYYIRSYATNGVGTGYGDVKSFTTLPATIPTGITTTPISAIAQTTCYSGGTISTDGGANITSKGVCWSSSNSSPTISNSFTSDGTGIINFSSTLTNLIPNTTYYVRAYAINSIGVAYGNIISFTTLANLSIGQTYQGGTIGYIYQFGDSGYVSGQTHGIIVASTLFNSIQWGCSGTNISGTNISIGSGQNNTITILNSCSTSNSAAYLCNNLTYGGYSDWYLPSYNELNKLYLNKSIIGGFSSTSYWTSSQTSSTAAYSINFLNGVVNSVTSKTSIMYISPIRYF